MPFFKRAKKKSNNKELWFPQLVLVDKAVDTQEIAQRIARESTASPADVHAVIRALPDVMADYMAGGRAVHLDGLGSFYLTCQSSGNGVATSKEVSPNQIKSVRVQFLPAREREGKQYTRALVGKMSFIEWFGKDQSPVEGGGDNPGGGDGDPSENPLG